MKQIALIKKVMCWHGYPCYMRSKIINYSNNLLNKNSNRKLEQEDIITIFKEYLMPEQKE